MRGGKESYTIRAQNKSQKTSSSSSSSSCSSIAETGRDGYNDKRKSRGKRREGEKRKSINRWRGKKKETKMLGREVDKKRR